MLSLAHILLIWLYILLPPAALIVMFAGARRSAADAARIGPTTTVVIASAPAPGLRRLDRLRPLAWRHRHAGPNAPDLLLDRRGHLFPETSRRRLRPLRAILSLHHHRLLEAPAAQTAAQALRILLLFLIGLPYMIIAGATYRPKTIQRIDSLWFDLGATPVSFASTDNLDITGLWIPAAPAPENEIPNPNWGRQTLLICPGSRGSKAGYLLLTEEFLDNGYNVLTFDFRGHGQSDGQIITFGDHERRDVLQRLVRWLRNSKPAACRRIVAVGIDTGAAALLAAAAEPSPEGRA